MATAPEDFNQYRRSLSQCLDEGMDKIVDRLIYLTDVHEPVPKEDVLFFQQLLTMRAKVLKGVTLTEEEVYIPMALCEQLVGIYNDYNLLAYKVNYLTMRAYLNCQEKLPIRPRTNYKHYGIIHELALRIQNKNHWREKFLKLNGFKPKAYNKDQSRLYKLDNELYKALDALDYSSVK